MKKLKEINWAKVIIWLIAAIIGIWIGLSLASCSTEKRCLRKYPPQIIDSSFQESSSDTVFKPVYLYDTIEREVASDQAKITDTATASNKFSSAKAWVDNERKEINLELTQKAQIRKLKAQEKSMIINNDSRYYRVRAKIIEKPYIPWKYKFYRVVAIPVLILIAVGIVFLLIKYVWPLIRKIGIGI